MATSTDRWCLLLVAGLYGCSETEVDLLLVEGFSVSSPSAFVCEDGTRVTVGTANNTAYCLGLECGSQDLSTYDCGNLASNAAAGTCVADFFAVCPVAGTCDDLIGNKLTFSNGARFEAHLRFYAPGSDTPCAQVEQTGYGSPTEYTWFREATVE